MGHDPRHPELHGPEQRRFYDPAPVDGRADIYALGVVLCEMLSGQKPHARPRPVTTTAWAADQDLSLPDLPAPVARVVRKALAPDPDRRYPTAAALAAAFRAAVTAVLGPRTALGPIGLRPPAPDPHAALLPAPLPAERPGRLAPNRRRVAPLLAIALAALLAAATAHEPGPMARPAEPSTAAAPEPTVPAPTAVPDPPPPPPGTRPRGDV